VSCSASSARARARVADQARQNPGTAGVWDQADAGEGLHETGRARRQHDVAGERDVAAGAGGDAIDRGNHGKRQLTQLAHQRIVMCFLSSAEHDGFARLGEAVVEVLSGTKAAPLAGDQQRAAALVGFSLCDCLA